MEALSLFLLKSIAISGLLTSWYLLGLRGRRLHQYNRFFLLSVLFFSLTIPFLHFRLPDIPRAAAGGFAPVALFGQPEGGLSGGLLALPGRQQPQPDWQAIAGTIAGCVSLTLLIILLVRILRIQRMCKLNPVTHYKGANLILTDSPQAPFTFLKYIFWNRSLPLQDDIGRLIFRHELAHIEQGHTYDKLAGQALTCIFWFNPFFWIIQKELNIVHEFIADEHAVNNRDTGVFALMLLRSYNNGGYLIPQSPFFSSSVKRRLAMLQNAAIPSFAALRRFMVVPLIAGAILLFSCSVHSAAAADITPAKKKIVLLLDAGHGGADAGGRSGGYTEKEICLQYARRIKELSPAYNVAVLLTRNDDRDVKLADRIASPDDARPDVFLSLHVGDGPGTDKEKGDFEIYVSGQNAHSAQSSNYSNAIFGAMAHNGIIPGSPVGAGHVHSPGCNCDSCLLQAARRASENAKMLSTEKEGIYVLNHVQAPGMVMVLGNIKNAEDMRKLADAGGSDMLCNAILQGIVAGATAQENATGNPLNLLHIAPADARCR